MVRRNGSGRFNWLELPASLEALANYLSKARDVAAREVASVRAWGEDGPLPLPGRGGIDAFVVVAGVDLDETDNLRLLACDADQIARLRFPDMGKNGDVVEMLRRSPTGQELVLNEPYDENRRFADIA